jgi:hypothetical protein
VPTPAADHADDPEHDDDGGDDDAIIEGRARSTRGGAFHVRAARDRLAKRSAESPGRVIPLTSASAAAELTGIGPRQGGVMKLRFVLLLAGVAALGVLAAVALASPPPGHGNGQGKDKGKSHGSGQGNSEHADADETTTTTGTTGTTTTAPTTRTESKKVRLCHRTGSRSHPWVLVSISRNAVPAHTRHGDRPPAANGTCAVTPPPTTTTTTTTAAGTTTTTP